ncbi:hypothetical protein FS749_007269 [Ceratobasidium sp. UAMH 11750]|nr:hypothetical protein FS749_007269 [Ceratobasidium sp. UAMH 11750]
MASHPWIIFTITRTLTMINSRSSEPKRRGGVKKVTPAATTVATRHPKFCFDNNLIALQIENTLFNVHKDQLMRSTVFSDMFAIAEESGGEQTTREGSSLDNPILIQGVLARDFECLMTILYVSHLSVHQPDPETSLIIPAFRLANMWNFAELCAYLKPLAERVLGDVDKILFAREFGVTEWLAPAHTRLCLRKDKITAQEAEKLGVRSLLFISRFREEHPRDVNGMTAYCVHCNRAFCGYPGHVVLITPKPLDGEDEIKARVQAWLDNGCVLPD